MLVYRSILSKFRVNQLKPCTLIYFPINQGSNLIVYLIISKIFEPDYLYFSDLLTVPANTGAVLAILMCFAMSVASYAALS